MAAVGLAGPAHEVAELLATVLDPSQLGALRASVPLSAATT
jgi:hypothetical protein